ncbi:MAG: hypothetical protein P8P74_11490 [Crocinitomicaceae bacterium]|nr:hypothetical protein [Crocinitomicaceae bacterium]
MNASISYSALYEQRLKKMRTHGQLNALRFQQIQPSNRKEINAFESAFYNAFIEISNDRLLRRIWRWDDLKRKLRLKISYDDLIILSWKSPSEHIKCSVAANTNNSIVQFAEFGFSFPKDKPQPHCEIVTLFTNQLERESGLALNRKFLKAYCFPFMRNLGYKSLYSTCARKPLLTYLRWGWKVIDETVIGEEERYFLHYDLSNNSKLC